MSDFDTLTKLKKLHPAWRLLAAQNAPFILSFFQRTYINSNLRTLPEPELISRLEDTLFKLREQAGPEAFPRTAREYLEEWASDNCAWLRKYYATDSDDPHYDLTPSAEKALRWLSELSQKQFIGTESRLLTIIELLRQIVEGSEQDPRVRIAELEKRKAQIEADIEQIRQGRVELMDPVQIKDRFLQMSGTAGSLLSDFREVEQNFRDLDRRVRERIATWDSTKGQLLEEIFGEKDAISDTEQGKSFHAFWDFLMSPSRQEELTSLLEKVMALEPVRELRPDRRVLRIHYDWLEAGEYTQRTVARLSEQLRHFLDDKAWLENRRIMEIFKGIEQQALEIRNEPSPGPVMEMDEAAPAVELAMERPLYTVPREQAIRVQSLEPGSADFSADALFEQEYVDKSRLEGCIRRALQTRTQISLKQLLDSYPLEQGLSELIAYFNIATEHRDSVVDESRKEQILWRDKKGISRRATMPIVIFHR